MNTIKFILSFLWMFIYRKSPWYTINRIVYTELNYTTYNLFRRDYILYFIPILIPIDYCTSIGNNHSPILSNWYRLYGQYLNNKYTITERSYYKPLKD